MKKLMIALAAVAMAAATQAATTDWKFYTGSSVLKAGYDDGQTLKSTTLYLIDATYSQDTVLEAFNGSSFDINNYLVKDNAGKGVTGTTDGNGKLLAKNGTTFSLDNRTIGESELSAYVAVLMTDGSKSYLYLSETVTKPDYESPNVQELTPSIAAAMNDMGTASKFTEAGWYTATAVPEPTSGLLLLLGVAGLALRRKQK